MKLKVAACLALGFPNNLWPGPRRAGGRRESGERERARVGGWEGDRERDGGMERCREEAEKRVGTDDGCMDGGWWRVWGPDPGRARLSPRTHVTG